VADPTKKGFPLWAKLLIAFGAFGVLAFLGVVALGVSAFANRKELLNEGEATLDRARRYGATHSQAECFDESFREIEKCSGLKCDLYATIYLRECMERARPSPEFCAQTADPQSVVDMTRWTMSECHRRGHGRFQNQSCRLLLQTGATACRERRRLIGE
jgi:hypothetical protein